VAAVFNQGSTFAVNLALANLLGRTRFGAYAIVLGTVQSSALLFGLALGYTATKYLAELRASDPRRAGRVLAFCGTLAVVSAAIAALLLFASAPFLARVAFRSPELAPLLRLSAGVAFCMIVNGLLTGALGGLEDYRGIGWIGVVSGTVYFAACVTLASRYGLSGAVGGMLVSTAVQLALLATRVWRQARRRRVPVAWGGMGSERGILLRFALPGALGGILTATSLWLGQTVLARQPGGPAQLGTYMAVFNLATIVLFLPSVANAVGMSLLNNMRGHGDPRRYRRVLWSNFWLTGAVVTTGALVMALAGRMALRFYGRDFIEGTPALLVLLGGVVLEALTMAMYQVVQSRERMWFGVRAIVLPRDVTLPVAALLLVPAHGAMGLAYAYLASRTVGFACTAAVFAAHSSEPATLPIPTRG
jgi:O-antigen/teichoic acid export membrane protein